MSILSKGQDVSELGNSGDWESQNLTVYATPVEFGGPNDSLFEENTYTIIYLEASMEIVSIATNKVIETVIQNEVHRIDGTKMKLMNINNYSIIANNNVSPLFKKKTVIFTIGKEFDIDEYNSGTQQVYVSRQTIPGEINEKIGNAAMSEALLEQLNIIEESKNLTSYELVNIKTINNITNSSVRFSNQNKVKNPKSITIKYDKSWGRSKIFAKGIVDNDFVDLDLKEDETLVGKSTLMGLIKLTPVSTQNRLTSFSDTLDENVSMPYDIASVYATPDYLRKQIVNDNSSWKKALWRVLLSILELTKAFSNGFSEYQITGNDGRSGVDPNATIGGIKIGLLSGTSANDALPSIDGRIEDWKQSYPTHINSKEFKLFKNIILMLSPFIQSSWAMSGGLNQGNKIYKLWWFDLRTSITKGIADNDTNDLEVQLKSEYYNISEVGGIITKTYNNVNIEYNSFGKVGWKIKIPTTGDKIENLTELVKARYNNNDLSVISSNHSGISPFYEIYTDDPNLNLPSNPSNGEVVQRNNITVEFYDTDKRLGDLELKQQFKELSKYQVLDIDGWASLVELPPQLQALNRIGKPGDIRPGSEDITKYWIYVPVNDQATLRSLYGTHTLTTSTGPTEKTITSSGNFVIINSQKQNVDASVVYNQIIKKQLSSNQRMKFINGNPDVRNIKVNVEPIRRRTCIKRGSPPRAVGGTITVCLRYRTDIIGYKYIVDYEYTVLQTGNISDLTLNFENAIQDKQTFNDFNKFNYTKNDKVIVRAALSSRNGSSQIKELTQLTMLGMLGNEFDIEVIGEDEKGDYTSLTLENLEFISKYDEIQTTTKVNF